MLTPARVAAVLGTLADLCEQQAYALEGDRAPTVALLSDKMRESLAELDAIDRQSLEQMVSGDSRCLAEARRLATNQARSRALLVLAVERLVRRRSHLSRAGIEWYAGKPVHRTQRGDLDLNA